MKKDKLIFVAMAAGLTVAAYLSSIAHAGPGAACQAFGLLAVMPVSPKMVNKSAPAPEWQLKDLDGKSVRLSDFKGKVVVLNFWATWCPPCRREIPSFVALQKRYGARGLVIVGVSLDENGAAPVKQFASKMGINYPVVMGDAKVTAEYGGIPVVPTTFVIDKKGKIVATHDGDAEQSVFEAEIKPLL